MMCVRDHHKLLAKQGRAEGGEEEARKMVRKKRKGHMSIGGKWKREIGGDIRGRVRGKCKDMRNCSLNQVTVDKIQTWSSCRHMIALW